MRAKLECLVESQDHDFINGALGFLGVQIVVARRNSCMEIEGERAKGTMKQVEPTKDIIN